MALAISKKEASLLKRIRGLLPTADVDAYLVGGWVRDHLLGRKTRDIDIAVGVSAPDFARQAAAALDGHYVLLDEAEGIARVVLVESGAAGRPSGTLISPPSGEPSNLISPAGTSPSTPWRSTSSDIGKRSPPRLIDPFGGQEGPGSRAHPGGQPLHLRG